MENDPNVVQILVPSTYDSRRTIRPYVPRLVIPSTFPSSSSQPQLPTRYAPPSSRVAFPDLPNALGLSNLLPHHLASSQLQSAHFLQYSRPSSLSFSSIAHPQFPQVSELSSASPVSTMSASPISPMSLSPTSTMSPSPVSPVTQSAAANRHVQRRSSRGRGSSAPPARSRQRSHAEDDRQTQMGNFDDIFTTDPELMRREKEREQERMLMEAKLKRAKYELECTRRRYSPAEMERTTQQMELRMQKLREEYAKQERMLLQLIHLEKTKLKLKLATLSQGTETPMSCGF